MRRFSTLIFFTSVCAFAFSQSTLMLEGHYQGKNFWIQNPYHPNADTTAFCIDSIHVNGRNIAFSKASAFELDLDSLGFVPGNLLKIEFFHATGCSPKILNPDMITPKGTYIIVSISVSPEGELQWSTRDEMYRIPYTIEAYRWNKWITLGQVEDLDESPENSYSFNVVPHSGLNKVRVVQTDHTLKKRPSEELEFTPSVKPVEILRVDRESRVVTLSSGTMYELYDAYGNMIKKGFGNTIDCSTTKSKICYLNYDNTSAKLKFKKKK